MFAATMFAATTLQDARPATELEGMVDALRERLFNISHNLESVYRRVVPPQPEAQNKAPEPVARTYAEKVQELINQADRLGAISAELNGRI